MSAYLQPSLKNDFAHYVVRRCILLAVKSFLPHMQGIVVDLGSGNQPYKEMIQSQQGVEKYLAIDWTETDVYTTKPDLFWDGITIPLADESVDCVLLTEVLEHLEDAAGVVREVHRVLRPGGIVAGTTPFVWPLHEVPHDMQRFTPFGVRQLLLKTGFDVDDLHSPGGWRTTAAQFLSAWVAFGLTPSRRQRIAMRLLSPLIHRLVDGDKPVTAFRQTSMINMTIFQAHKAG